MAAGRSLSDGTGNPEREIGADGVESQYRASAPAQTPRQRVDSEIWHAGIRVDGCAGIGGVAYRNFADGFTDDLEGGRPDKHQRPALGNRALIGHGNRMRGIVERGLCGIADHAIRPYLRPGLLVE